MRLLVLTKMPTIPHSLEHDVAPLKATTRSSWNQAVHGLCKSTFFLFFYTHALFMDTVPEVHPPTRTVAHWCLLHHIAASSKTALTWNV